MKSCQRSLLRLGGMRRCVGLGLHDKTAGWQRASQQGWGEPQHIWCTHTLGPMYCYTYHTVLLPHHVRLYQWQWGLVKLFKTKKNTNDIQVIIWGSLFANFNLCSRSCLCNLSYQIIFLQVVVFDIFLQSRYQLQRQKCDNCGPLQMSFPMILMF